MFEGCFRGAGEDTQFTPAVPPDLALERLPAFAGGVLNAAFYLVIRISRENLTRLVKFFLLGLTAQKIPRLRVRIILG